VHLSGQGGTQGYHSQLYHGTENNQIKLYGILPTRYFETPETVMKNQGQSMEENNEHNHQTGP
jgi:hypothetical protein